MSTTLKLITVVVVLAAVVGVVVLKQGDKTVANDTTLATQTAAEVATVAPADPVDTSDAADTAADQTQSIPAALPQLVDLGAGKCIPCKAMAPILEAMREDFAGQFDVTFIDVWEDRAAGEVYGIRMIPTQIFFDAEGKELFRHEGFYSREEILAKWDELGVQINVSVTTEAGT